MNKCAIYCRLSKEDVSKSGESESILNQKILLNDYARVQNWEIYGEYIDEDYSGIDKLRPAFTKLLSDAGNKKFDIILCKTQSRFTRDMELVEKYIHGEFLENNIRFVSVLDNIDTQTKGNKKSRQINGLINEWYLEDLSENIKAVFEQKRKNGQYIGSFALYGYKKSQQNKNKLVIDDTPADIVREIFRLYLAGDSMAKIAEALNKRGELCPMEYKKSIGLLFSNGKDKKTLWNSTAIGRILKNQMYTGTLVQGKRKKISYKTDKTITLSEKDWVKIEGAHEGIVDKKTFEDVQKKLGLKAKPNGIGKPFILSGKVFCRDCKSPMQRYTRKYKGNKTEYLRCGYYGSNIGGGVCTSHSIRLDKVINKVLEQIDQSVKYKEYNKAEKLQLIICRLRGVGGNKGNGMGLTRELAENVIERIEVGEKDRETGEQTVEVIRRFREMP